MTRECGIMVRGLCVFLSTGRRKDYIHVSLPLLSLLPGLLDGNVTVPTSDRSWGPDGPSVTHETDGTIIPRKSRVCTEPTTGDPVSPRSPRPHFSTNGCFIRSSYWSHRLYCYRESRRVKVNVMNLPKNSNFRPARFHDAPSPAPPPLMWHDLQSPMGPLHHVFSPLHGGPNFSFTDVYLSSFSHSPRRVSGPWVCLDLRSPPSSSSYVSSDLSLSVVSLDPFLSLFLSMPDLVPCPVCLCAKVTCAYPVGMGTLLGGCRSVFHNWLSCLPTVTLGKGPLPTPTLWQRTPYLKDKRF